jgi:hypothetical protein
LEYNAWWPELPESSDCERYAAKAMSDIRQLRLARLKRIKQRGIWRFIWTRGILGWGLSCGILFTLFLLFSSELPLPSPWYFSVPMILSLWMIGGVFFGLYMWFIAMLSYSRALKSKD